MSNIPRKAKRALRNYCKHYNTMVCHSEYDRIILRITKRNLKATPLFNIINHVIEMCNNLQMAFCLANVYGRLDNALPCPPLKTNSELSNIIKPLSRRRQAGLRLIEIHKDSIGHTGGHMRTRFKLR